MLAPLQDKHKGVTVASFDTTADELETLTAELGVKGLPQFRFYKASWLVLVEGWLHGVQARRARCSGMHLAWARRISWPGQNCAPSCA